MNPDTGGGLTMAERAIALVERGWSYRKIAKVLSIGKSTVGDYVAGEYGGPGLAVQKETAKAIERARLDRVLRRVDRALRSLDDEVAVKAAAVLIKASESRRKMDGLDAPTKVEKTEPDDIAKMSAAEKLAAHEKAAEELRREIAEGKDGMH